MIKSTAAQRATFLDKDVLLEVITLPQVTRCSRSPNHNTPTDGPTYTKYLCKDKVGAEGNLDPPIQVRGDPGEGNYKLWAHINRTAWNKRDVAGPCRRLSSLISVEWRPTGTMKIVGGDYFVHCVTNRAEKKDSKSEVVVCGGKRFLPRERGGTPCDTPL